jgi:hypothetical protein
LDRLILAYDEKKEVEKKEGDCLTFYLDKGKFKGAVNLLPQQVRDQTTNLPFLQQVCDRILENHADFESGQLKKKLA